MTSPQLERAAARATTDFTKTVERLSSYLRYPAISCDKTHRADIDALAEVIAADLTAMGLQGARVLTLPDALPLVAAEWLGAGPQAPTLVIYGHLDLQPVQGEPWTSPPHEPTQKGDRLYARGAADDMGGWVSHLGAIDAWLQTDAKLPCNVRLIIESEEEIGSPNLERYMDAYPEAFQADAMILTDCENPATDLPGLTVSLRGLFELEVTCAALSADGHSGLWGNMVPDVSTALVTLLARLVDRDGRLTVAKVEVPAGRRAAAAKVPIAAEVIHKGAHLLPEVQPLPERGTPAGEWLWLQPALTIVCTTLPTRERKKNALRANASATLSIRLGPGQRAQDVKAAIVAELTRDVPQGVIVTVKQDKPAGEGWYYEPKGPAFEAVDRAYLASWGHAMVRVGVGGSIPFVALFGERFGGLPLILNGVMDPESTAHGPDESLHLGLFQKAILANVHLLWELAQPGILR